MSDAVQPRWSVRLLAALIAIVVAALGGEVVLRVLSLADRTPGQGLADFDPMRVLIRPLGAYGYRQQPGAEFHYVDGAVARTNAMGFRGPPVAVPKPAGTYRIVLLGGSTSFGFAVDDSQTIDSYLRSRLAGSLPGRRIEVVNLALDGYDSYQDLERFREDGLPLEPDLVIVNSGINDVRSARYSDLADPDPRTLLWQADVARLRREAAEGGPTLWTRLKHFSFLARLPGYVRGRLQLGADQRTLAVRDTTYPAAADLFERHVRAIMALELGRGGEVLLSPPPSSLATRYADTATSAISYWVRDAATTEAYRIELAGRLRRLAGADTTGRVRLVSHALPDDYFLDDCHLTAGGNARMADDFAAVILPLLNGSPR